MNLAVNMNKIKLLSSLFLFSSIFSGVQCERTFLVVGSQTIPFQDKYTVAVSSFGYDNPENLQLKLYGKLENGKITYENVKNATLRKDIIERIEFDLKNQSLGNYFLKVTGQKFEQSARLNLNTKKSSVYIQTDKAIYKPGDKVQFRVLVLNADTKPFVTESVEIFIKDANDNRIKQFDKIYFTKGVFKQELQLSDEPVLGLWAIYVKVNGNSQDVLKNFEVAEYVLPKYQVNIVTKPHISKNEDIIVSFNAKYTYGKEVEGTAIVSAEMSDGWWGSQTSKATKLLDNSTKTTSINLKNDLNLESISWVRSVLVIVTYTEALTGKEQSASTTVFVHDVLYTIEMVGSDDSVKPGIPFTVNALVKDINEVPVTDDKVPLQIKLTYTLDFIETNDKKPPMSGNPWWWRPPQFKQITETSAIFLKNGIAQIPVSITSNVTSVSIESTYKGATGYSWTGTSPTESNQYIKIVVPSENLPSSKIIALEIISNVKINSVNYVIFGRNKVAALGKLRASNSKRFKFNFLPTIEMIPSAKIIAFYVTQSGEVISDRHILNFDNELKNFVNINISTTEARPSSLLNITVKSKPLSYVGLLGVDQSVLLLKSGNDIDKNMVNNEQLEYSYANQYNNDWQEIITYNYFTDFSATDAIIITNANDEYRKPFPIYPVPVDFNKQPAEANFITTSPPLPAPTSTAVNPENIPSPTEIATRKNFPETWLFDCIDNIEGTKNITRKVPDTISSWIITGFSMDFRNGLGLTKAPTKLNVFMPFFISLNLPYSVKREEIIAIQANIFNYMNQDYPATVTMSNDKQEFEFVENVSNQQQIIKNINSKANSGTSVKFLIKPLKVGYITLKIEARTSIAGDRVENLLLVEAEGITKYFNEAVLIDLRTQQGFDREITITVPQDIVPDSFRIESSIIGDILGPTFENLDNLIRMPYGCGEQNMLNFVPNIIALDYLKSVNKLTPEIETKAISYMESGYQRELTYKRNDGSYSAFGNSDNVGSTWLSAFVARSFNQASKYITVDQNAIDQALKFLENVQVEDGSFPELGTVHHKPMQGGSSGGTGLTAYVLLTFLENQNLTAKYKKVIDKAVDNLVINTKGIDDVYAMSIAAYALYLADRSSAADSLMQELDKKANNTFGTRHWDRFSNDYYVTSLSVETSAYALLAYLKSYRDTEALLIVKWLVSQRNSYGGFSSTQDTVIGLLALSRIAEKISSKSSNMKVDLKYLNEIKLFTIDQKNALVLQKLQIPSAARTVRITASGSGFSLAQISYHYNIKDVKKTKQFILNASITSNSMYSFSLKVCVELKDLKQSNMAVMEVSSPSGYTFDNDNIDSIIGSSSNVKRAEFKKGNTLVNIYFDYLQAQQQCLYLNSTRAFDVADQKPAPIVVYDYYENDLRTEIFYTPSKVLLCDICNSIDCKNVCK